MIGILLIISLGTAARAQSHYSGGVQFSAEGGVWQARHLPALDLTDEVSLEATVFFQDKQPEGTRIIDKFQSNSGSGGFVLGIGRDSRLWMVAGQEHLTSDRSVPLNQWVRLIGTFSKSKNQYKLYINDDEVASSAKASLSPMTRTNFPLRVGADSDGRNNLTAKVAQVAVYSRYLNRQEIIGGKKTSGSTVEWLFQTENQNEYPGANAGGPRLARLRPVSGVDRFGDTSDVLWYRSPATAWETALPIGNGRLGAMLFGGPDRERFQLNDISVWSGSPQPDADQPDAYKHLPEVRKAIREQQYELAEKLTNQYMTSPAPYTASYQTLGDLSMQFELPKGDATQYKRWLDIKRAVSGVSFKIGTTEYSRETFSSAPDQAIVSIIKSSAKGGVSFTLDLTRLENSATVAEGSNMLVMKGNTGKTLDFEVQVKVVVTGGSVKTSGNELIVNAADQATLYLTAGTSYVMDYAKAYKGEHPHARVTRQMGAVSARQYNDLLKRHSTDYQQYFNRVRLNLGTTAAAALPTDERLRQYGDGKNDPSFASLFYDYGRYLLISSSRPDNPLPSNSQGIWGDGLSLPWLCDYKSNINYQMNYWPVEQSNLSELHLPMLRQTQSLRAAGAKTAKAYFGPDTPGWYYGYTTNGWGWTSPGAKLPWGVFAGGSGWACQHLWEHYAFTRDKQYLQSVYPTLKGAAEFYLATMIEDENGNLITSPSTSPENYFKTDDGQKASVSEGNTMERSIIWDLFDNTAHAAHVLGTDAGFAKKVTEARDKIRKLQTGRNGQLMEWGKDWDMNSDDLEHRHVSHLFALHPGHQITAFGTPELAAAAKKSLEIRGNDGTGWSIAWKENFWARLRDGDQAHKLLSNQLRYTGQTKTIMAGAGGTYPNLFDAHPPFQIDGNFGAVSGMTEMLLQSMENYAPDKYVIDVLPALPSQWAAGSVKGLRARGGFEIGIEWETNRPVLVTIESLNGEKCLVRSPVELTLDGTQLSSKPDGKGFMIAFDTQKGKTYRLLRK
nr:glycoside hydrolase N-terminal domain-containing protein [uncultured Dyadobacter sp.]